MYIELKDNEQVILVYLSNYDREDMELRKKLSTIYDAYRESKYRIVEFYSGKEDLYKQSLNLLLRNRNTEKSCPPKKRK